MKLALIRQKYTPFGGAERFVERALTALAEQGAEVTLLCREWTGGEKSGFPVEIVNPPFYRLGGRKARDASFAQAIQSIIAVGRFDLVQSHERIPGCHIYRAGDGVHATWLDLRARRQNAAQRFATRHHPWHRFMLEQEAAMFRHPDLRAVICNSRMVKDDIATRFGVPAEKLHLIRNGVDIETFHPRLREIHRAALRAKVGAGETAPVILFVGSGYARKGVATLLAALARMNTHDAELWIVGRDKQQGRYERQAKTLGVASRVRFLGAQTDVRPFYGAADLFCLPTLYDPFPNAALEALACGLPLVTTTSCGAAEIVTPGVNGYVAAALDTAALAQHLDALCMPGVAATMIPAARAAANALNMDIMARQLLALYASLDSRTGDHFAL
ncbi:MAG: glycosyltransferase family 4 protein [Rhodocyclaceae bacterium]|nr:glycosyltransferase family 4 protein [Rhodocyclaceae bacterium]